MVRHPSSSAGVVVLNSRATEAVDPVRPSSSRSRIAQAASATTPTEAIMQSATVLNILEQLISGTSERLRAGNLSPAPEIVAAAPCPDPAQWFFGQTQESGRVLEPRPPR